MKLCLSLVLFTAACATTGTTTMDREPSSRAKVTLDLSPSTEERAVFPAHASEEPRLPSVDRIAHQVRAQLGDVATLSIELCVGASGKVTKVAMLEGTSYEPFNAAVVRDIEQWQFASMPGATAQPALQTCERAKVKYVAAR